MKSFNLSDDCCLSCKDQNTLNLAITNTLPTSFDGKPSFVFIIANNTTELDLTGWNPTGLCSGSTVRIQKGLKNSAKIIFNDGTINYKYINRQGEIITLVWSENNKFEII